MYVCEMCGTCYSPNRPCPKCSYIAKELRFKTWEKPVEIEHAITTIVVKRRSGDYHACINGNECFWGCGKTIEEAIGSVLKNCSDRFKVKLIIKPDNFLYDVHGVLR